MKMEYYKEMDIMNMLKSRQYHWTWSQFNNKYTLSELIQIC